MKARKQHFVWVLQNRRGTLWLYTNGKPVTYRGKREAQGMAAQLYEGDGWKAARAELTVNEVRSV